MLFFRSTDRSARTATRRGRLGSRCFHWSLLALAVATLGPPRAAEAQTLQQIFKVMQDGGTWLSLPIEGGKGSYTGVAVPTMGMEVEGWFQIADVHRGEWSIRVVDLAREPGATVVDAQVVPGQRVPVDYDAGPTVKMKVDVTWSEPADTLLWVWVGLPDREAQTGR